MALRLSDLAARIPGSRVLGTRDPQVEAVTSDSREVAAGALFVAVRGFKSDGHNFLASAIGAGASAVAGDDASRIASFSDVAGCLFLPESRSGLAALAAEIYGHPSAKLRLIGATGTNGKTTTVSLVAAILEAAGCPSATLGTLGLNVRGKIYPGDRTTPEAPAIQCLLRDLVEQGIGGVAMEVSSHALDLHRTDGLLFDAAVFTNLTQDHLDYHPSMEAYYQSKRRLFTDYVRASSKPFSAIINVDDPYGARLAAECDGPVLSFGLNERAALRAENAVATANTVAFTARCGAAKFAVRTPMGARFNIYNTLGAVGVGLAIGIEPEVIACGLDTASAVNGRFESVDCGQAFTVIVDYAHTPDGLVNVLKSAREIAGRDLITVFGCGGDRDRSKRPQMGRIAAELADLVVVTSDNPRSEEPEAIIQEILAGIAPGDLSRIQAVPDRRTAIATALSLAQERDVVVIAGKGHETYQIFKDTTIHFDDREIARAILSGGDYR